MREKVALAVFLAVFCMPIAIYIVSKFSRGVADASYRILGIFCLVVSAGFFAYVGWYFLTTGQLVSPGKYGIPSRIIRPTDPLGSRLVVGGFNVIIGSLLAVVGIAMLKIKREPRSDSSK